MAENRAELKARTYLRSLALQCLYENDISGHDIENILVNRFGSIEDSSEDEISTEDQKFVIDLVVGVLNNKQQIDDMITKYAVDWPLEQIAAVDRNIIRIAAYEFAVSKQTPNRVAINEAIELAKAFGSESAPKFVNGVLGSISDNMEA